MERHLLFEIINGKELEIEKNQYKYFSLEFITQYNLIKGMKALDIDINKDQLYLFAQLEGKKIDLSYAEENTFIVEEDLNKLLNIYIKASEESKSIKQVKNILDNYSVVNKEALVQAKEILEAQIDKEEDYEIQTFETAKNRQLEYIEQALSGEEVDGLYLYSRKRNTSRQFMRLSYRLKYIDRTDLVVIGGRPSVGKTSFVLSLMNVLSKNGYKSLMFSLEMSSRQVIHRMATAKSGVTNNEIFNVKKISEDKKQAYLKGLEEISKLPIKIIDEGMSSWLKMKQIIKENKDDIDYVVIDHLTYIPSFDGDTNLVGHQMISKIIRDIKETAKELEIPIILLAQFSRGMSSGQGSKRIDDRYQEPFMRDFRESGSIEEYANKILLLYRNKDEEDLEKYNVYSVACKVEKNRDGQTGKVNYYFYADQNRWREEEYKSEE